jgi:hypothetical protein
MTKARGGPKAEPTYLKEPNYYRLGYQLSAQLLNSELAGKHEPRGFRALDVLFGEFSRGPRQLPVPKREGARTVAERFCRQANQTLTRYEAQRDGAGWGRFWRKLGPSEERLRKFLRYTVIPCLELVVAGSLRSEGEIEAAEKRVRPLRARTEDRKRVSYRVLYNLACYETGAEQAPGSALAFLRQALRKAPEDRQHDLAKWARKDPSLSGLHAQRGFDELLDSFGAPKTK